MTRQQAIAAAPQTRKAYRINISIYTGMTVFCGFLLAKAHSWNDSDSSVWPIYVLSFFLIVTLLQVAERLIFPVRTALRSRALNIQFGRRISAISTYISRGMLVAVFCALTYHLITRQGPRPGVTQMLIICGFLVISFTHDFLGHKYVDTDDFEHSPPLTDLKPLQSEHWGSPHAS